MKRFLLLLIGWLLWFSPHLQGQITMQYWFDGQYASRQELVSTSTSWQPLIDVGDLSEGLHALYLHVSDTSGRWSSPRQYVFYRAISYDSVHSEYAMDYVYWFDHDYSNRQVGTIGNGNLLLDVSQLREGLHTISMQIGQGRTAQLQEYVFFKPVAFDSLNYNYTMDYSYWFDHDYSGRQTGSIGNGSLLLDVSQLREGLHTISMQIGQGRTAQLQEYVFFKPMAFDSLNYNYTMDYSYWFDHDYNSRQTGSIGNGSLLLDVSHLAGGLHTFCIQMGEGRYAQLQQYVFYKPIQFDTLNASFMQNYTYWYDRDYSTHQSGSIGSGALLLDVAQLSEGIHTLSMQIGEGSRAQLQHYVFMKPFRNTLDTLYHITRYDYTLNGNEEQRHIAQVTPCDTLQLVSLLPVDTLPIRSMCFHFNPNGGSPVVNAKNDIRLRFWTEEHRFAEYSTQYIDENIVDTVYADTIERGAIKTIAAPTNNDIHWFKLAAGTGDSLSFSTNRRCTMQLYAPSGEMLFMSSGDSVLSWVGCHAWENGVYYLAVHDAEGAGNMTVSYQWIYRYAVLAWDVHRVGNGGISTITFEGNGFNSLDTVFLVKGSDTIPTLYIDRESKSVMSGIFDFENADTGSYNAMFVFVDENLHKTNVVAVDTAVPIVLTSTVSYPETFLRGSTVTYTFEITNTGNMTAYNVPLYAYIGSPTLDGVSHIKFDGLDLPSIIADMNFDSLSAEDVAELREWAEEMGDDHYFFKLRSFDSIAGDSIWVRSNYFFLTMAPYETRTLSLNLTTTESVDVWFTLPDTIEPLMPISTDTMPHPMLLMAKTSGWGGYAREGFCCVKEGIECTLHVISALTDIASTAGTDASILIGIGSIITGQLEGLGIAAGTMAASEVAEILSCYASLMEDATRVIGNVVCLGESIDMHSLLSEIIKNRQPLKSDLSKCIMAHLPQGWISDAASSSSITHHWMELSEIFEREGLWQTILAELRGTEYVDVHCITKFKNQSPNCPPKPPKGGKSNPQQPVDPNEITGYLAESGSHAVGAIQSQLPYMIEFENDTAFATAHAHTVVVRDTLDGNVFDLSSFAATAFGINENIETVNGGQSFNRTVDMRPEVDVLAQVRLDYCIDSTFAVATWTFSSIDPMTLQPTVADSLGFLGIGGTGEVNFTINRKASLPDSTVIANRAVIKFDNEEPIGTSTWTNTIDATPPVSAIDNIVYSGDTAIVTVSATDNLSGAWRYHVYAQMNDNTFQQMAMNVPIDSNARFVPQQGTVQFRSVAIDSAGNKEAIFTVFDTLDIAACDSYTFGSHTYTVSGEYVWTRSSALVAGCDSITILRVNINRNTTGDTTAVACDNQLWHGTSYTSSGSYDYTYSNFSGCDSVVTLHLTINNSASTNELVTACDEWHGFTGDTVLTTVGIAANGCDSTHTITLTVNRSVATTEAVSACDSWQGYTADTVLVTTATAANGCDSTHTVAVTINHSVETLITDTAEDSYTWHGNEYTESGTYTWQGTTSDGCDSTVTLMLVISQEVGIEVIDSQTQVSVYPNPTSGWLTIGSDKVAAVEVFDPSGRRVAVFHDTNRIYLGDLPSGGYLLRIHLVDSMATQRVQLNR